jgi:hypothetical protein
VRGRRKNGHRWTAIDCFRGLFYETCFVPDQNGQINIVIYLDTQPSVKEHVGSVEYVACSNDSSNSGRDFNVRHSYSCVFRQPTSSRHFSPLSSLSIRSHLFMQYEEMTIRQKLYSTDSFIISSRLIDLGQRWRCNHITQNRSFLLSIHVHRYELLKLAFLEPPSATLILVFGIRSKFVVHHSSR